ncbi:RTA1 domain-containing protein [Verticillium dahliae VdLs.17]|uniref:RTA1 domain-containing protein n=2 Tax=Verticillium dahliae TaxID=27337 RepID=G2X9Q7_VERDV|nr:RTA1 domain-containing protein [Verticillium dahliae VdLs.17]EGY15725.1 RTA1 domain-containing protein [Verticillium dahliae VdLs.17]KAF3342459.1 hypothetical protein VdG2_09419 [Verticillium dahliae VDG2]KAH6697733.1 RTA1 domain-containing protein [Verticillium dahliae]
MTALPGKYGRVPYDACKFNNSFEPEFAANCAFAVLFGLTLGAHLVQAVTWKKRFCWVVTMAAAWECTAFALKSAGARDQQNQIYAILGRPAFLPPRALVYVSHPQGTLYLTNGLDAGVNAFVYMTISRLVYYVLPDRSIWNLKATQLTKLFVWIDVLCFLVQAGRGSLLSGDDTEMMRIGQYIYVAGCAAQLFFIVIFCALMGRLYVRMREAQRFDLGMTLVKSLFWALLAVLIFIMKKAMNLSHVKEAQRSSDTFEMNEASERGDGHAV